MYFNSFEYILFLWTVYVLYWTLRNRRSLRVAMVVLASYWFYAQADWRFTGLLLASTLVDYYAGGRIETARAEGKKRSARAFLGLSLVSNLGMLGFFKYYDFFVDGFEALFASVGAHLDLWHLSATKGGPFDFIVPAGISFYTFQTLSYTIDIYYGRLKPCRKLLDFAMYVAFFPQLVAGPIVRARDFLPQMRAQPVLRTGRISSGLFQILRGMAKKLLVADFLGAHLVDVVFRDASTLSEAGGASVLLAAYGFTMQVYGDFAGYSDIAIGSARLLGFELRKNFDAPFKSRSLEEFWTRWHISMSFWFYYYVFTSLGGNKRGFGRMLFALFTTHVASGLWHGAGWNYVLWGVWFGLWMIVSRVVRRFLPDGRMPSKPIFSILGWAFTYHVCVFSLIFFRAANWEEIAAAWTSLLDWSKPLVDVPWQVWAVLAVAYATSVLPDRWNEGIEAGFKRIPAPVQGLILAVALVVFLGLAPPSLSPFIYFQF